MMVQSNYVEKKMICCRLAAESSRLDQSCIRSIFSEANSTTNDFSVMDSNYMLLPRHLSWKFLYSLSATSTVRYCFYSHLLVVVGRHRGRSAVVNINETGNPAFHLFKASLGGIVLSVFKGTWWNPSLRWSCLSFFACQIGIAMRTKSCSAQPF